MCKNQRLLVKYKTFSASHRLAWNVSLFGCYKNKRRMCARVEGRGVCVSGAAASRPATRVLCHFTLRKYISSQGENVQ